MVEERHIDPVPVVEKGPAGILADLVVPSRTGLVSMKIGLQLAGVTDGVGES